MKYRNKQKDILRDMRKNKNINLHVMKMMNKLQEYINNLEITTVNLRKTPILQICHKTTFLLEVFHISPITKPASP